MNTAVFVFASVLASGQPGDAASDGDRASIRCRPAPFYVADRMERPKPERLTVTGSRVPVRSEERRARPCHLMQAPMPYPAPGLHRVAD